MRYVGTCEYCGGETSAYYKSQLKRFCSHTCSNRYKWENLRARAETVKLMCGECGKEFEIKKSDHRFKEGQKVFYCSKGCSTKHQQKEHIECVCIICGKHFWKGRTRYNLCSTECVNMKRRYLKYKRLYDHNISLPDFLSAYKQKNPFVWAGDKKSYMRQYNYANKNRINQQRILRNHSDDLIEFKISCRSYIQRRYKQQRRFSHAMQELVGCTMVQFRKHIASLFTEGMSEFNYGEWELDHIIPLASAATIEDAKKLFHYSNYQPLWAIDNRRKRDMMPNEYEVFRKNEISEV